MVCNSHDYFRFLAFCMKKFTTTCTFVTLLFYSLSTMQTKIGMYSHGLENPSQIFSTHPYTTGSLILTVVGGMYIRSIYHRNGMSVQ
jgi:hypothetical protein